jgi:hypothetical protein
MSRIRIVAMIVTVASLVLASAAGAARVTGGTTTITASTGAAQALAANHITVTALAPATASGTTFTFPISGGRVNAKTLRGFIVVRGGVALSGGTRTIDLRRPTVISTKSGVSVFALARRRVHRRCHATGPHRRHVHCTIVIREKSVRIARISGLTRSGASVSGTVTITGFTADALNKLAGQHAFAAGDVLGTATATPTLAQ